MYQSIPDFFFQGVAAGRRTKGDLSFGRSESAIALLQWILIIFPRAWQTESPRQAFRFSNVHHTHILRQLKHAHLCYSKYAAHTYSMLLLLSLTHLKIYTHTNVQLVWNWLPPLSTVKWLRSRQQWSGDKGNKEKTELVVKPVNSKGTSLQGSKEEELKVTL